MGGWPNFHRLYESKPDQMTQIEGALVKIDCDRREKEHKQIKLDEAKARVDAMEKCANYQDHAPTTKITKEVLDWIMVEYNNGESLCNLCKKYQCARVTLTRHMRRAGVKLRTLTETAKLRHEKRSS